MKDEMSTEVPRPRRGAFRRVKGMRTTTLVWLGIVAFTGVVVAAWFAGEGTTSYIFAQLEALETHPPLWLRVPPVTIAYLLAPTAVLMAIVLAVMKISPRPNFCSRFIVVGILLTLTGRYILWRSLATLNLADPLSGVFSLGLFFWEMLMLLCSIIQLSLMLNVSDRRQEADRMQAAVSDGTFTPSVDILVPTYNEPDFILRRTIIGCQALEYDNKKIYLLDDTRRPEIKQLAEELGCAYITRYDNFHAKAGNLNNAIAQTDSELIVVFDADFVPTKNFLTRTVGFFQDEKLALVQTPQSFYNADPIARNLGLEKILMPDEELFYRQVQPIRDAAGTLVCSGTSFVVRRNALQETGGFVTESVTEDYFTGVNLAAKGYRLIYLDEKLSAGLATENISAYVTQRMRWARGTVQAFFIKSNPLIIPGLSLLQRLSHLEGLLYWFNYLGRVYFLVMPLIYSFLGVVPIRATGAELLYFLLPYYLVQLLVFSWLNYRSRSALLSDIYSLVLCFPITLTVIQVMLNPFSKGFKVTPKGMSSSRFTFNWALAWPMLFLFVTTSVSLWLNLGKVFMPGTGIGASETVVQVKGTGLGWLWSSYNLLLIGVILLILLDIPKTDLYEWFELRRVVRLNVGERTFWGVTTMISEVGATVAITQAGLEVEPGETLPGTLLIMEEGLELQAQIVETGFADEFPTVQVAFEQVSQNQHRRLVEMLFCRPGQWKHNQTPGELQSLWLIFRVLLAPRSVYYRRKEVRACAVSQV